MVTEPHERTEQQHETLRSAMDRGYYEIPRRMTTTDLAEELGVSHQAVSERLRRGHRCLVEHGLPTPRK
ncbi:DNA binding domain-containing protein [Haladaptatus paucihalophilus DX253]|uniref:DNA binding domain-containing protein n=1 Tax=Haladaptatus paucihalophilus DX253 TaxID=797209 RepID=E7QQ04_HALPU|nr:helix-turn-helix domain-containing protein [Haladaptatus paucihalophilus]EFW93068.1 DNA binding domain-containing protein [Haladaptatus paucihalophilus DX253]SHK43651.1 HTH DNA binding domain-containing protein [Haladaptatus paucihalophilus DX253]